MSDQTHLSNLFSDEKAWPVYLTLRNLPTTQVNKPRSFAFFLLELLPVHHKPTPCSADHLHRQIKANTLRGLCERLCEPLLNARLECINIHCTDRKVVRCFPIFSAWIADHMENIVLYRIKLTVCPKREVLLGELGTDATRYQASDYARDKRSQHETDNSRTMFENCGIDIKQNVFHRIDWVSAHGLLKPDLLHTV